MNEEFFRCNKNLSQINSLRPLPRHSWKAAPHDPYTLLEPGYYFVERISDPVGCRPRKQGDEAQMGKAAGSATWEIITPSPYKSPAELRMEFYTNYVAGYKLELYDI